MAWSRRVFSIMIWFISHNTFQIQNPCVRVKSGCLVRRPGHDINLGSETGRLPVHALCEASDASPEMLEKYVELRKRYVGKCSRRFDVVADWLWSASAFAFLPPCLDNVDMQVLFFGAPNAQVGHVPWSPSSFAFVHSSSGLGFCFSRALFRYYCGRKSMGSQWVSAAQVGSRPGHKPNSFVGMLQTIVYEI